MIYGYIRVSTDRQTVENQRFEIKRFCKRENLTVDRWIEETISGTKDYTIRRLGRMLKGVAKDDLIICTELSRLGRSLFMIMEILNVCMTRGVRVWTIKDSYRLGDDIHSKVLAFAFGLSAEIERDLISQRTREALARRRAAGMTLGRPPGSTNAHTKLGGKREYIISLINSGMSKTKVARRLHVSRTTLYRFLRDNPIKNQDSAQFHGSQCQKS